MTNVTIYPRQDAFETTLSQEASTVATTLYINDVPSYTPTTWDTYAVINADKSNAEVVLITSYDSTLKTLTVTRAITRTEWVVATAQTHTVWSKLIISDNFKFWDNLVTAIWTKLDNDWWNPTTSFDLNVSWNNFRFRMDWDDMKFTDNNTAEVTLSSIVWGAWSTLQAVFDWWQSIIIGNTDNQTLSLTNNDTTNNQNTFNIVNNTTWKWLYIDQNVAWIWLLIEVATTERWLYVEWANWHNWTSWIVKFYWWTWTAGLLYLHNLSTWISLFVDQDWNTTNDDNNASVQIDNTWNTGRWLQVYSNIWATTWPLVSFIADNVLFDKPVLNIKNDWVSSHLRFTTDITIWTASEWDMYKDTWWLKYYDNSKEYNLIDFWTLTWTYDIVYDLEKVFRLTANNTLSWWTPRIIFASTNTNAYANQDMMPKKDFAWSQLTIAQISVIELEALINFWSTGWWEQLIVWFWTANNNFYDITNTSDCAIITHTSTNNSVEVYSSDWTTISAWWSLSITNWDTNHYRLVLTPWVDVKTYINWVLVETKTTNIPPAASTDAIYVWMWSEASARDIYYDRLRIKIKYV